MIEVINLSFHECYSPRINVDCFKEFNDKNNVIYYRAYIKTLNSNKYCFVVRSDFVEKWKFFEIASLKIKITKRGASLIDYQTFSEIREIEKTKFVEIEGIYLSGTHDVKSIKGNETVTLIPTYPNRKRIWFREYPGAVRNPLSFKVKRGEIEEERIFLIITKTWEIPEEYYSGDIATLDVYTEYSCETGEVSLVYQRPEAFLNELKQKSDFNKQIIDSFRDFYNSETELFYEMRTLMEEIKRIAIWQSSCEIVVEYTSKNKIRISDHKLIIALNDLEGNLFNTNHVDMIFEHECSNDFGMEVSKENAKDFDIEMYLIFQL